jgi:hypothetical protein
MVASFDPARLIHLCAKYGLPQIAAADTAAYIYIGSNANTTKQPAIYIPHVTFVSWAFSSWFWLALDTVLKDIERF